MHDRLVLALRPWTYSDIGVLWSGLLALMAVCVLLQSRSRARLAHQLMMVAGTAVTGTFAFQLVTHYARCSACSVLFDLSPNASSWAFFYDYVMTCIVLAVITWRELRRYQQPRTGLWALAVLVVPLIASPLVFAKLHELEARGARREDLPSWRWIYVALVVMSAPFVMPALPRDHFGDLGGEFFWDSMSTQANTYIGRAVLLAFGQVFLFTLPRTKGFWLRTASLFLAFNCLAAYVALFFVFYDGRFATTPARYRFTAWQGASQIGAILAGNMIAAAFGVTLRFTHFVIKPPEQVCHEGQVTRARALPECRDALQTSLSTRTALATSPGANDFARALPDETRTALQLVRDAIATTDSRQRGALTRQLGRQHGADLASCQEAASANYAVLNECPE